MENNKFRLGMIGLGAMGRNLVWNMADNGFSVVGFDKDKAAVEELRSAPKGVLVSGADTLEELVLSLETPRIVMMMVPAGPPVDAVIHDLVPLLAPGDLIVDGGNSHFTDTELRAERLMEKGIHFLGVGISGGEDGARHGPSIMPGGPIDAYPMVQPIFETIAAHVEGTPCVTYLGPKGAGHYVKMVHNGIEYGLMQLIAESYDLMKRGLKLNDAQLHQIFSGWNQLELNSYLIEITANIFTEINPGTGKPLIDVILDEAKQKGTGKWASENAMDVQSPTPSIDIAVDIRNLSTLKAQRKSASQILAIPAQEFNCNQERLIDSLRMALYAGMILTFAQGFALLHTASESYEYHLDLAQIAQIWRGGCIIRASLLTDIHRAFAIQPDLPNLLLDSELADDLIRLRENLSAVIETAMKLQIPIPGFMAALAYLDGYRSAWLPANLIQAQRDYFGAHTYERIDKKGTFHHDWTLD